MESVVLSPQPVTEEDEEAQWENFNPMEEDYQNPLENSYMHDSVGGTLPRKLLLANRKNPQHAEEVKLYVSKIPKHVTESGLRNIFSLHGKVLRVHIVRQNNKEQPQSYHFGFISLSNIIEADHAIQALNNTPPFHLHIEFEMSEAEKKERLIIEKCSIYLNKMTYLNLTDPDMLHYQEADYSIKENISYSPCLPGVDFTELPSCVDSMSSYHLYESIPQWCEFYEPYLIWDAVHSEHVSHAVALRHYPQCATVTELYQDVQYVSSAVSTNKPTDVSMKTFGVQGTRSILSCAYCKRRVFKTSPHVCRCGAIYDDKQCQYKHWPQHKPHCITVKNTNDGKVDLKEELKPNLKLENNGEDFDKVIQAFKSFYAQCGTVLDKKVLNNTPINMAPELWWDSDSALVFITNEVLVKNVLELNLDIEILPDAMPEEVHIGQLVGVFLDKYELYVRGIVVLTTRLGLIGVLALELGTFVLVPSVKPLPALSMSSEGAYNVHCNIVIKDDGFVMEATRLFTKLKDSTHKFRAFDTDYNACTVQLSPYLPCIEQLPLLCICVEDKSQVILTAFHSVRALYVRPLDLNTRVKYASIASAVNLWCSQNQHLDSNSDWIPNKNEVVGVRLPDGEYRRGQIIGTVELKRTSELNCEQEADSNDSDKEKGTTSKNSGKTTPNLANSKEKRTDSKNSKADSEGEGTKADKSDDIPEDDRYYVVSLIDFGSNMKVSSQDLEPCCCSKISLKNQSLMLNVECYLYLDLLVRDQAPLIVNLMDEEESMADLFDENGKSICNDLEKLTALPWKIPQGIIGNPLQSEHVSTLPQLQIPLYPLLQGDRIQLKLMKLLGQGFASMMVLSREEHHYVQTVLTPCIQEYCEQLSCDKYNPCSGAYCMAYCRDLKLWTRAHCDKSSQQHGHVYLFLVDYGVHAHLPITDIRPCHEWFTKYHALSFIAYVPEFESSVLSEEDIMRKYETHEYTVRAVVKCKQETAMNRVLLSL
ncbi:hypothetical protein M8J75_014426 [Diaphorina citri]|nr:hypothetical protein M8J75_014426 [Diaphorina citri]